MVVHQNIAKELEGSGGHLECTVCGQTQALGSIAASLGRGWPKHCGYTMSWITARQLAARG